MTAGACAGGACRVSRFSAGGNGEGGVFLRDTAARTSSATTSAATIRMATAMAIWTGSSADGTGLRRSLRTPEKARPACGCYSGNEGGALVLTASSGSGRAWTGREATAVACHLRRLPVSTPHLAAEASQATTW